ncbi:uncharacterized protein I206_107158 [Kwoniella pini CBS 10737]|uniref:Mediator of RNA polymerase II transcription subunit 5 n=1 Tax=Kwoniella pini CBS 10737 TaxID=1296096 RepID=A0A1B9HZ55_9TREE|nr:uncharacterized protein I206_05297 [Kwoniella pini CBS 10737]OCF48518.1 hypothetical protein I206_05297 [Kwoniella pini CBS 10737]
MAQETLSLSEVIGRAYARALPPKKFVQLLKSTVRSSPDAQDDLASAILPFLLPSPPSLILSYLTNLLSSSILTSRTIFIHILFYLSDHDLPPIPIINSIFNILASNLTGLEEPIPSFLSSPSSSNLETDKIPPEVGTSASAMNSPIINRENQMSTLSLILPLLKTISSNPSLSLNSSLVIYLSKVVSILSNFPLPSLDVGLEVGGLLPDLPEEINTHLRDHLSGLMTDLNNQGPTSQIQMQNGNVQSQVSQGVQDIQMNNLSNDRSQRKAPLKESIIFLIEWLKRSSKFDKSPRAGKELGHNWILLLKAGKYLTMDSSQFLSVLLEVGIQDLIRTDVEDLEAAQNWNILVGIMPALLSWWKEHAEEEFPFPVNITEILTDLFRNHSMAMQSYSENLSQRYTVLIQNAENEEEGSTFTSLEGWTLLSLQETLISKLVQSSLITSDEASTVAPGANSHTFSMGESLTNRLSSESHPHLPPLVHTIQYAYSASASFSEEVIQIIKSCPSIPPPESVFTYIASQPGLLGCLTSTISAKALLSLMEKQLLDIGVDENSRNDDPQGSLTRFGEGVALVEAFVAFYQLPLPPLLQDARCASSFSHLDDESKECMNGWVKAIFGSDGIEDAILLATPPQKLYSLTSTLIQQAILAVAASQIDLDTLHSGLSYFSQPLLSWCLGGVVSWLCKEIKRQGLLSALHLVVLQDLILGHSCPEALIRVNLKVLNDLLNDNSLIEVFQSSNFDLNGIKLKLNHFNLNELLSIPSINSSIPLNESLKLLRKIDENNSSINWEKTFFNSIENELKLKSNKKIIKIIFKEIFNFNFNFNKINNDNLIKFIPLILNFKFNKNQNILLLNTFINFSFNENFLKSLNYDYNNNNQEEKDLIEILKNSLIFNSIFNLNLNSNENKKDFLILNFINELEYLFNKSLKGLNEISIKEIIENENYNSNKKLNLNRKQQLILNIIKSLKNDDFFNL